ncbi:M6 metalloprotease [Annulohypoxylon truncatum]|uniref:M6 metalloprotease n=1 Tax=Annulohypoxylon truncatum TaxID=327061 RepID=UPI002008EA70|nr:M6 metalloprotease [Annulohypoxylon truncatum]KAI1210077.1 M6 metalloprotease [Annulohypoxylon truncatum]
MTGLIQPFRISVWCLMLCAITEWVMISTSAIATSHRPQTDISACKLAANSDVYLSAGFGYELNCAPSTGTLNAFMIFVDFDDEQAIETPQSLHDFFLPAAAEWYATSSYGALTLNVTADTSRFYRMPATAASYGWARGLSYETHEKYIQDALDAYNQTIPPTDVLYVVPTANAAAISFSPTFMGDVQTRAGVYVAKKSVTFGLDAYKTWKYLVLNHETGHTMCLPDYYPFNGSATGLFIGGWDLMGLISGPSPDYFAWDKWRLGWLSDEQIDCIAETGSTTHMLTPLEQTGGSKAVVIKHNSTDVLVAELRSTNGLDSASCSTGVLLYTVSTITATGDGPVRVLDATPGSNGCAGDELNDAPLSLKGTNSYTVSEWGIKVTIVDESSDGTEIRVDVS